MNMHKQRILFLCTGNSCRSQMAEGWARLLKSEVFEAYSAGVETHGLNPMAVKVMNEVGVDISDHRSKLLDEFELAQLDCIITVCGHAQENCPLVPAGCLVVHRGFDDPPKLAAHLSEEEDKISCYRKVRDQIREYVESLPDSLPEKGEKNEYYSK